LLLFKVDDASTAKNIFFRSEIHGLGTFGCIRVHTGALSAAIAVVINSGEVFLFFRNSPSSWHGYKLCILRNGVEVSTHCCCVLRLPLIARARPYRFSSGDATSGSTRTVCGHWAVGLYKGYIRVVYHFTWPYKIPYQMVTIMRALYSHDFRIMCTG